MKNGCSLGKDDTRLPWENIYNCFCKWSEDGILVHIFHVLILDAKLEELYLDSSVVQAYQHSAGAAQTNIV